MTKPYAIAQESVYSLTSDHFFTKWITRRFQVCSQGGRASWTLAWTFYRAHSCSGSHSKLATFHLTLYVYWESIHRGVYKFSLMVKEVSQSLYFLPHDRMQKMQVLISDSMVAVKYATQISFKRPWCRKHESLRTCIFGSTRPAFILRPCFPPAAPSL